MKVIAITGGIAAGKSMFAEVLSKTFDIPVFSTSTFLKKMTTNSSRQGLQAAGNSFDEKNPEWIVNFLSGKRAILDCVRTSRQLSILRKYVDVYHIHLMCDASSRLQRFIKREAIATLATFIEASNNKSEQEQDHLMIDADVITGGEDPISSALKTDIRLFLAGIDVLFGGQWGSEGKGHIASYIGGDYDAVVRTGGPNAGHQVKYNGTKVHTFYHIPSVAIHHPSTHLHLGPGTIINELKLLREIEQVEAITGQELNMTISPAAWHIKDEDMVVEEEFKKNIGSTGQGVGAAAIRRIRRKEKQTQFVSTRLRRVTERWQPSEEDRVLIEGTQGYGLSMFHGQYPFTTSRDTGVAALLSESGLNPARLESVYMVTRTYPIRVQSPDGGSSGPMGNEVDWEHISKQCGIPADVLIAKERTSTTNRLRRVADIDYETICETVEANGVTDIALTFVDYICEEDAGLTSYNELSSKAKTMIERMEDMTGVRVSLLSTGFSHKNIIDRR